LAATAGGTAKSAVLLLLTRKSTVWLASSAGPARILVAQPVTVWGLASSATVWFAPLLNDGASLIEAMSIETLATFESAVPSLALKVKLSDPL